MVFKREENIIEVDDTELENESSSVKPREMPEGYLHKSMLAFIMLDPENKDLSLHLMP